MPATKVTSIASSVDKFGRTGPLTFVMVPHNGRRAIKDEHDIAYRDRTRAHSPASLLPAPPGQSDVEPSVDERLLFRFSALISTSHRIHYDLDWYHREEDDGHVIHGPLLALMMCEHMRREEIALTDRIFGYRSVSPWVGRADLSTGASRREGGVEFALSTRAEHPDVRPGRVFHWCYRILSAQWSSPVVRAIMPPCSTGYATPSDCAGSGDTAALGAAVADLARSVAIVRRLYRRRVRGPPWTRSSEALRSSTWRRTLGRFAEAVTDGEEASPRRGCVSLYRVKQLLSSGTARAGPRWRHAGPGESSWSVWACAHPLPGSRAQH